MPTLRSGRVYSGLDYSPKPRTHKPPRGTTISSSASRRQDRQIIKHARHPRIRGRFVSAAAYHSWVLVWGAKLKEGQEKRTRGELLEMMGEERDWDGRREHLAGSVEDRVTMVERRTWEGERGMSTEERMRLWVAEEWSDDEEEEEDEYYDLTRERSYVAGGGVLS